MGTPNKYRKDYCVKAEEILETGKSLAAVCSSLDIGRSTLYEWRETHPEFREAIDRGLQKCQLYWENIGEEGIKGNYEKFGAAPWIFTMKNRFRADYAEDKENTGDNAVSVLEKIISGELKVKQE